MMIHSKNGVTCRFRYIIFIYLPYMKHKVEFVFNDVNSSVRDAAGNISNILQEGMQDALLAAGFHTLDADS